MTGAMAQADGGRDAHGTTMLHLAAIQGLVEQLQRPLEEIAAVYQCELVQLGASAIVTDFLPVLVAKRVRSLYRHRLEALYADDPCRRLIPDY